MNIAEEIKTITPDELTASFKASRLKYTMGYGLVKAMDIPAVRRSLELHALHKRRHTQPQHGTPAPIEQAA